MSLPITIEQLNRFWDMFQRSDAKVVGLRFGQAWINEHLPSNQADAEVFYERNDRVAYDLILEKYVEPKC